MIEKGVMIFKVELSVDVKDNILIATLLFANDTSDRVYLEGKTLCWNNRIERNVFVIKDKDRNQVGFIGSIQNRILKPEDFIKLEKGERFEVIVPVNEMYKLLKGENYSIQFSTYNPANYDPNDQALIKLISNTVDVTY